MRGERMLNILSIPTVVGQFVSKISWAGCEGLWQSKFILKIHRVRNFRGRVSNFHQSEARKHCFLASDWLKFETLPRKFRPLLL